MAIKCRTGFKHLEGSYRIGEDFYPSPLMTTYTGSLAPNREYESKTGSLLRHRTFRDNPLAANGTRPNLCILDEVGFMTNLQEAWGAIEATQASKSRTLVIWGLGTGGLVSGKAALYAEAVFRNPADYNCVEFEDAIAFNSDNNSALFPTMPISKLLPPKLPGHSTYLHILYIYNDWNFDICAFAMLLVNIHRMTIELNKRDFFIRQTPTDCL